MIKEMFEVVVCLSVFNLLILPCQSVTWLPTAVGDGLSYNFTGIPRRGGRQVPASDTPFRYRGQGFHILSHS